MHSVKLESIQLSANSKTTTANQKKTTSDQNYDQVIADYSKALELDSGFTYAWYNRANAKVFMHDYTGAVEDLSRTIFCDGTFADAYFNRGILLIFLEDNTDACADLSKAGELGILPSYNVMKRYCYK